MFTIVGFSDTEQKRYATFNDETVAIKQLKDAKVHMSWYAGNKDDLTLRVINSTLGEFEDIHHKIYPNYRIEQTH